MLSDINEKLAELGYQSVQSTKAKLAYWDKHLICRFANRAYLDWFGKKPEEVIDKMHIKELLGDLFEQNLPHIRNVLSGRVEIFQRDIPRHDGVFRSSIATYIPDYLHGSVQGFFVHVTDISPGLLPRGDSYQPADITGEVYFQDKYIKGVVKTLEEHILKGFPGVSSLAKQFFVSESKLKRDFKNEHNDTIFSYFRNLQMQFAHNYIVQGRCSKKQMAQMLGFLNHSNFSARYHKYVKDFQAKQVISALTKENDERYRVFINENPFGIVMLDHEFVVLACSQKWISDYGLQQQQITGKRFFELLPGTETKWEIVFNKALKGEFLSGEDQSHFGPSQVRAWQKWDVRPWHKSKEEVGGILVYSEDITASKLKEEMNRKILEIYDKTSMVARIGAWKRNFVDNSGIWSPITRQLLEVPEDFVPDIKSVLSFYKKGASRDLALRSMKNAKDKGKSFDIVVDMVTFKGNVKKYESSATLNSKTAGVKSCWVFSRILRQRKINPKKL